LLEFGRVFHSHLIPDMDAHTQLIISTFCNATLRVNNAITYRFRKSTV
jgi:hypothetical protein